MQHFIKLLPDALANQIAAGEVVQRPASVVKELLENAIDAGATRIDVVLKDAGKTLIQISDNGTGMSVQDARMAFERHATSKISSKDDLFNIRTLGFRGEALASIAAVAQVKLRTRLEDAEIGTEIDIEGSEIKRQEACVMPRGTVIQVKNLFFNVPARRNFLKSNPVETRHILNEIIHVALSRTDIHITLVNKETQVYDLHPDNLEKRIVALFGPDFEDKLLRIDESTGYVSISGLVGSPLAYRKNRGEQYFFVNGRYIRSNYLNHAISEAYKEIIPEGTHPFYCIFLDLDPVHVDINIHPTKTEVKFDDERTIYVLVQSMVKRALAEISPDVPQDRYDDEIKAAINNRPPPKQTDTIGSYNPNQVRQGQVPREQWEALLGRVQQQRNEGENPESQKQLFGGWENQPKPAGETFYQSYLNRYILTRQGEDLLIIDKVLAHQRILFERLRNAHQHQQGARQQLLFPQNIELTPSDHSLLEELLPVLTEMGFDIKPFGPHSVIIHGTPAEVGSTNIRPIFEQVLSDVKQMGDSRAVDKVVEGISKAVALRSAIGPRHELSALEMRNLVQDLLRCEVPTFSPTGKPTTKRITAVELEDFFQ